MNALKKHFKVAYDAELARKLNWDQANLTRWRKSPNTPPSPGLLIRCHDYAGFSIEKTRELCKL